MRVLIVGNGFDRKLGLKTDYNSFLDWMKEQGYGVGEKFKKYSDKLMSQYLMPTELSRLEEYKSFAPQSTYSSYFIGDQFIIKNGIGPRYFDENIETKLANTLLYLLPEIVNSDIPAKTENANVWYIFIQLLRFQKHNNILDINTSNFQKYIGDEGNWVDIEGLIQKSIETRILQDYYKAGIFSVSNYFDVFSLANLLVMDLNENYPRPKEEIYKLVWTDFLEFKKILCNYLASLSEKIKNEWHIFENASILKHREGEDDIIDVHNYDQIIDFNYTDFGPESLSVYYVHGNIDDSEDVVFGLDMNIKDGTLEKDERKTTFELGLTKSKQLLKFSKISQLLHLQIHKVSHSFKKITQLSIVGHSIGEQDYSYYFSILDRNVDDIQVSCLWYEFNEGGNNKEFMKNALFEMLTAYERYSNQRILHKMIFEGRIKFKEVFIPQLSEYL